MSYKRRRHILSHTDSVLSSPGRFFCLQGHFLHLIHVISITVSCTSTPWILSLHLILQAVIEHVISCIITEFMYMVGICIQLFVYIEEFNDINFIEMSSIHLT